MTDRYRGTVRAPEFPAGLEWLNVDRPLTLAGLRGKVVLLDFWTFCCINCMHVLPRLQQLEERFPDELVVIGVHSAKFDAEKETYNLRQAVMRLNVQHPVVNDRGFLLWRAYATRAWPTVVVIDPEGKVVGAIPGEFDAEALGTFIQQIVDSFAADGRLDRTIVPLSLEKHKQVETLLSFPGKVLADERGGRLFVADSEHHRILQFDLTGGRVRAAYGCGEPGLLDGSRGKARFRSPQGMALHGNRLYVADTENHALRQISLDTGTVTTIAGNGSQAAPIPDEGTGRDASLNSPWDLEIVGDILYIAMAGSHQLWAYELIGGRLRRFAGDGREALLDGPRLAARLAQPSGLCSDGERIWFADSEISSLRSVPIEGEGEVRTAIGQGLFDFGDVDGSRKNGRLQHPLGVACAEGLVYLVDSYNNKLKIYEPVIGEIRTLAGTGEPGPEDGPARDACFWEPGGISIAGDRIYVADTNNHAIRVVSRWDGEVETLELRE